MRVSDTIFYLLLILLLTGEAVRAEDENKPLLIAQFSPSQRIDAPVKLKIYRHYKADGSVVFSDSPPATTKFDTLLYDCYACQPESTVNWHRIALNTDTFIPEINAASSTHKLDKALIRAVIHAESNFDPHALSRSGAKGLMQLMPPTAKELGVIDAFDVKANVMAGSEYLSKMLSRYHGDLDFALAAYNAGPANVKKYRGIPPFAETRAYVKRVKILLGRYQSAL